MSTDAFCRIDSLAVGGRVGIHVARKTLTGIVKDKRGGKLLQRIGRRKVYLDVPIGHLRGNRGFIPDDRIRFYRFVKGRERIPRKSADHRFVGIIDF